MNELNQPTSIAIPAKPEYVGIVRMMTAAFAGFLGFDNEATEDIKIAVSEACTNAILQLHKQSCLEDRIVKVTSYANDDDLIIDIEYLLKEAGLVEQACSQSHERDLGMSVLMSIMDQVEVMKASDQGVILRLVKKLP